MDVVLLVLPRAVLRVPADQHPRLEAGVRAAQSGSQHPYGLQQGLPPVPHRGPGQHQDQGYLIYIKLVYLTLYACCRLSGAE